MRFSKNSRQVTRNHAQNQRLSASSMPADGAGLSALPSLLRDKSTLADMAQHCARLTELASLVRNALPASLQPHVTGAVIQDDRLVIFTHAAAWASQIRYYSSTIVTKLREAQDESVNKNDKFSPKLSQVRQTVIKVRP